MMIKFYVAKHLTLKLVFIFYLEATSSMVNALLRELKEETSAACKIKRFLGYLQYSFETGHSSICHNHEYNFIFEAESEFLKSDYALKNISN